MPRFDHVILTAANDAQARGFEAQLEWRRQAQALDGQTQYHVMADPGGRRVGTLGATLLALQKLSDQMLRQQSGRRPRNLRQLWSDKWVLIIHSGGESRRLPAYAAEGKVFTPLPTTTESGLPAALFDLCCQQYEKLPRPRDGGVLVVSGDVLLSFDPEAVVLDRPGVVGVAYPGPAQRGAEHGVYVAETTALPSGCLPVADFLQKPNAQTAKEHGAVDPVGRVLVDTGIISFDAATAARLLTLAGITWRNGRLGIGDGLLRQLQRGPCPPLDLYEAMTMALAGRVTTDRYRRALRLDEAGAAHARRMMTLYRQLHQMDFSVNVLPYCDFLHAATSGDLLSHLTTLSRNAQQYGFANLSNSVMASGTDVEGAFAFNTIATTPRVRASAATLLESVHADVPIELAGRNILVGLPATNAKRSAGKPIRLRDGLGMVCLPIGRRDWAAVLFGIDDDFKGAHGSPEGCQLLNEPIDAWLKRHRIEPTDVWPAGRAQDLWHARLWTVATPRRVIDQALWMQSLRYQAAHTRTWKNARRQSLAELLGRVNYGRLLDHRREIHRLVQLHTLGARMMRDDGLAASDVAGQIRSAGEVDVAFDQLRGAIRQQPDPLFGARALHAGSVIAEQHGASRAAVKRLGYASSAAVESAALAAVAEAVTRGVELSSEPRRADVQQDQVVWATTPVRLDFAGGWSDTPPFCTERGGSVLNAAVTLNGQYPVQAVAKLNGDHIIRLSSIDLGRRIEITTTAQLLDHHDPRHWAALPKAALVLAGIGPTKANQSLRRRLETLGGGIDLTIFSAVPKGSGLGTSSILGATVLACLRRIRGERIDNDRIIGLTSVLEQYMTTGGGWQDQVGGILPGVKLIRTQPGLDQTPAVSWTVFDRSHGSEMRRRLLLYYTGLTRMAKHILRNVVGRYLARDAEALRTIDALKDTAVQMKSDLDRRDINAFAGGVERYWTLKKTLDPGSTNQHIERLLESVDRWTAGRVLAGAGGGGFVFFVAHDPAAADKIRRQLERHPPSAQARFFDFDVDAQGLNVTVL